MQMNLEKCSCVQVDSYFCHTLSMLNSSQSSRILLAEDEASLRDMIALNLELEGYAVQTAVDGKIALEKALTERFDLLILDVMLPSLDGFSLCERIRLENPDVMILFLTARNSSADRVQGLKLGADACSCSEGMAWR